MVHVSFGDYQKKRCSLLPPVIHTLQMSYARIAAESIKAVQILLQGAAGFHKSLEDK